MDFCNKVLSKAPISWPDVQKQLFTVMQSRTSSISSNYGSSVNSLGFNKASVKQCTDLLIKHIKSNSIFFGQYSYKFLILNKLIRFDSSSSDRSIKQFCAVMQSKCLFDTV